ncbi:MAG: S-layer homology domain-containing protein [Chloroflexota bacterium]|nr:S-layer homology domain-containing protein [Chloroflexota bacterium]
MRQLWSRSVQMLVMALVLLTLPVWASATTWAKGDEVATPEVAMQTGGDTAPGKSEAQAAGCAPTWQHVPGTDVPGKFTRFNGVEALAEDDVWAVGSERRGTYAASAEIVIEHWDGNTWMRAPFYDQTLLGWISDLADVAAVAPNDAWAVGTIYDGVNVSRLLILHWDGAAWTRLPDPLGLSAQSSLISVEAIASNDVWAVGSTGRDVQSMDALILHWDGSKWSKVRAPDLGQDVAASSLRDITVIAPDDIWAVGSKSTDSIYFTKWEHLVLHWDGSTWNVVPTIGLPVDDDPWDTSWLILTSITGTAPDDIWVAGHYSDFGYGLNKNYWDNLPGLFTAHWNGNEWSEVPSPPLDVTSSALFDVKALAPDDVWAVGTTRRGCCFYKALVLHWNGGSWSLVPSFSEGSGGQLAAIDSLPGGELWAAGTYSADNRTQALAEHYTSDCPPPPPTCSITFSDVPSDNTFYPSVRCMACRGIANGYEDGTFRYGDIVTRGQMAKMVSNAAGFSDPIENYFGDYSVWADVPVTHTFYIYTARLALHSVATGYMCGENMPPDQCEYNRRYFHPSEKVTRGQAAQFVSRSAFLHEIVPPGQQTFADVRPGAPFWSEIERVAQHGGIRGYPCGTRPGEPCDSQYRPYFRPSDYVTRGQATKFLANIFYPECQAQYEGQ